MHVYYPIARDPAGRFETFDEKLDALIRRRRQLATDFLAPLPGEEDLERELLKSILEAPSGCATVAALSRDDVRLLPWPRFEALMALLEEKRGARVILTPCAGDDKADVIAVRKGEIRLVQCKHSFWGASVDADALAEVIGAMELYRVRYLRRVPKISDPAGSGDQRDVHGKSKS